MSCTRPPSGWYCTRAADQEGPCAAHPMRPTDVLRATVAATSLAVQAVRAIAKACGGDAIAFAHGLDNDKDGALEAFELAVAAADACRKAGLL